MTIAQRLKFLFTTLHSGTVNLTLHVIGIPLILAGLIARRPALIALAVLLAVIGHGYNYTRRFDQEKRRQARAVFPLQALITVAVMLLLLKLFNWF